MGIILAKFKKKSTYEVLENLEERINEIEEFNKNTEANQKKFVRIMLVFGFLVMGCSLLMLYFSYDRLTGKQALLFLWPLIAVPILIWFLKSISTWYVSRKLNNSKKKLKAFKEEKKQILDKVMDTETYKVAKKILDKFGNEVRKPIESSPLPSKMTPIVSKSTTGMRQRFVGMQPSSSIKQLNMNTPMSARPMVPPTPAARQASPQRFNVPATPLRMPRSVLPRDRSVLDKMVDYLVGDGPYNRFALICKQCNSHNGMALKEEFEYVSFRCCYCQFFNPARKQKPSAPKMDFDKTSSIRELDSSDSKNSSDSDDVDSKPIITELPNERDSPEKLSDFDKLSDLEQNTEVSPDGREEKPAGKNPFED